MGVDLLRGVLGLLVTGALITSCAPRKKNTQLIKKDLGVLVQIDDPRQLQALPPEVAVEPLLEGSKLYRLLDIGVEEAKSLLPTEAIVAEEVLIQNDPVSPENDLAADDDFFSVRQCNPQAAPPLPVINLVGGTERFVLDTLKLGSGAVEFTASKSLNSDELTKLLQQNGKAKKAMQIQESGMVLKKQSNILDSALDAAANILGGSKGNIEKPNASNRLKFEWRLITPKGSKLQSKFLNKVDVEFTPDRKGAYTLLLRVDDAVSGGCLISQPFTIGVTENVAYKGATSVDHAFTQADRADFAHISAIEAEKAWTRTRGEGTVVAVIDTGVNYNHPELSSNIKINSKEIPDNNLDDDKNGLVDDVYGWDFLFKDNQAWDDDSHGTHVAGLAAGRNFGVANRAQILPIKVGTPTGITPFGQMIAGIQYAVDQGADVINISLGINGNVSPELRALIQSAFDYAESKGVVIVTAAGNGSTALKPINNDVTENMPSNMKNVNNIAVAATDLSGRLTTYSQFGAKNVDVAAPGGTNNIPLRSAFNSTDVSLFIRYSGTSMASPIVAGTVALMIAADANLTPANVRNILMSTSLPTSSLQGRVTSGGMINANRAVEAAAGKKLATN